jgi:predicted nuclease of predicted toxin-antitoxin system
MTVWLDAHLSPGVAQWLTKTFDVTASPVRDLGLLGAEDDQIFFEARKAADVVITKDVDFVILLERHGSPPKIIWHLWQHSRVRYCRPASDELSSLNDCGCGN